MWIRCPFLAGRFLIGTATILVLGGIAYKIHNDDVARIEKAVGKRAEKLEEPDLLNAMKKLGIGSSR